MKNHLLIFSILILWFFCLPSQASAVCCFPYNNNGYIDPLTGFYVGISELQNDSYFGLPFGNVTYRFEFLDKDNNVIFTKTKTITSDLPIKTGFEIPPGLILPFTVVVDDAEISKKIKSFQFAGTENLQYSQWKPADLFVTFEKIDLSKDLGDYKTWEIQGTVKNNHTQSTKNVFVLASIYQNDNIIGVAGYSSNDRQPLVLNGLESKNFVLYATIPAEFIPDRVGLYAESDDSSMMHQHYTPLIMKDASYHESRFSTDPEKPITISANLTNISRNDLNFEWILQIKKSPKSISDGDFTNYPESKVAFIKAIPTQIGAQQNIKLEYSWSPQSNGVYFYEMYAWTDSKARPLSYPFAGTFLQDNWIVVNSNLNSPLKQLKSGTPIEEIKCKESLILVQKYNGVPSCVKYQSGVTLTGRNWIKSFWIGASGEEIANSTGIVDVTIPLGSSSPETGKNYEPSNITIVLGINNTVRWTQQDEVASTVISNHDYDGYGFVSPHLFPGYNWSHTFTKPGVYEYHSMSHPWKYGTIFVLENPMKTFTLDGGKNGTFEIPYSIVGAELLKTILDVKSNSIIITLHKSETGHLTLILPKTLLDALVSICDMTYYKNEDHPFFVLIDGEEMDFKESIPGMTHRILDIPFSNGSKNIEIIQGCYI